MSDLKKKLSRLNKIAAKRPHPEANNDSTITTAEDHIEEEIHHEEVVETTEEVEQPDELDEDDGDDDGMVEFEQGATERGAVALWHEGYRYIRKMNEYWRCSNKDCGATAIAKQNNQGVTTGRLGKKTHNHLPEPARRNAETLRNVMKKRAKEPRAKQSKMLAEERKKANEETFVAFGSDDALRMVMSRTKKEGIWQCEQ